MTVIKDPLKSYHARVSSEGQLWTEAEMRPTLQAAAELGEAYQFPTPVMTLPGTSEYAVMRFSISDIDQPGHLMRLLVGWNGGSTNHNRCLIVRLYIDMDAPTANAAAYSPGNMYLGSSTPAQGTFHQWNGVGNGMTVASNGTFASASLYAQGRTAVEYDGALILPNGSTVGVTVQGEEVGLFTLNAIGFFDEVHSG